jgi:cytochrome c oxidase assembly protein subunit 11
VRFDASKERDMPWEFRPVEREMELRIGETGLAFYEAYNPTDRTHRRHRRATTSRPSRRAVSSPRSTASASRAGAAAGRAGRDAGDLLCRPRDRGRPRRRNYVHTITLSYTFYEIDLPEEQAALDDEGEPTHTN